jgi:hypothetical protein
MANALYDPGREGIADRTIDLTGDVRAMLVLSTYTFSAAHKFLADLGVVDNGRTVALASKTVHLRRIRRRGYVAHRDRCDSLEGAGGVPAHRLRRHRARDRLHRHADFRPAVHASGGQTVNITWDNGTNRIFKL